MSFDLHQQVVDPHGNLLRIASKPLGQMIWAENLATGKGELWVDASLLRPAT